jgi:DNA mismatch endonuclease (patch repair protein)
MVFPSLRKIIDVRGCFWHRHTCNDGARTPETNTGYWAPKIERNVARDCENEEAWRRLGWDVLVLWECQIKGQEALKQLVLAFLPSRLEKRSLGVRGARN